MIYLDVINKINAESKHAIGLDSPCLAGKAEEVRSRNSEVRIRKLEVGSRKSEVGTRKSEVGSQKWPSSAIVGPGCEMPNYCVLKQNYLQLNSEFKPI